MRVCVLFHTYFKRVRFMCMVALRKVKQLKKKKNPVVWFAFYIYILCVCVCVCVCVCDTSVKQQNNSHLCSIVTYFWRFHQHRHAHWTSLCRRFSQVTAFQSVKVTMPVVVLDRSLCVGLCECINNHPAFIVFMSVGKNKASYLTGQSNIFLSLHRRVNLDSEAVAGAS